MAIPKILGKIYSSKFDIIHLHYGNLCSLVKLLYWGKKPIVSSYCGDDLSGTIISDGKYSSKSLFFKKLNIILARKDACSIVKSKILSDKIKKAKRIEIIPNGVDVTQFKETDKSLARKYLRLNETSKIIILFPADPSIPSKNFKLLEQVASTLNKMEFEILTFVGNSVKHNDIPYYFNAADIVVFTSLSEGSPNVIKEAMACNCKIYSTDCGDVAWLLKDVKGSKILSYDVSEWQATLIDFINNRNLAMSDSRVKLLAKRLDMEFIAKRIVSIYTSLIR